MKPIFVLFSCLLLVTLAFAQQKVIPIYNGPAPGSEAWTWTEAESSDNEWHMPVTYNVSKPTLTVFSPEAGKANGTAIVICPGGGFQFHAIEHEGYSVAKWLVKKGVTCFILKYRLAKSKTTNPVAEMSEKLRTPAFQEENVPVIPLAVADGRAAIAYVRTHAAEYNVDPNRIGIMGFSAGGTVTASALYNYTKENRPDFAAPVYAFFPSSMLGTVPADAPPLFVVAASDDGLGLAPHSVELYNQWLTAKHDAELHMYARGNHGFGMNVQHIPTDNWIERFGEWLDMQGLLKKKP